MAGLAGSADAFFFMAAFALLVSSVFELGSLAAVMAAAAGTGFNAFVMAGFAIANALLVSFVREGHGSHFGGELDDFRTIVSKANGGGTESDKTDGNQNCDDTFHVYLQRSVMGQNAMLSVKLPPCIPVFIFFFTRHQPPCRPMSVREHMITVS